MNVDEVRFNVFADAIKRTRWFLLITTLLSCMLLIHMYVEQFSFQEQQNIDTIRRRLKENRVNQVAELEQEIRTGFAKEKNGELRKLSDAELDNKIDEYAITKYNMTVFDNILKEVSIPSRQLPILLMNVPGNDFLPIIGVMLLVFVIAVWLNIRSVLAAIHSLKPDNNEETRELIRLHFTFTGLVEYAGMEHKAAQFVQYAAFALPCISFLIAMGLDISSIIYALTYPDRANIGPLNVIISHTLVMIIDLILLFIFTRATVSRVREIARMIHGSSPVTAAE